jgi:hypothetical protein
MTYHLPLRCSEGTETNVPVRLPDSFLFDCFLPGLGIMSACFHPTSLGPAQADVGGLDVWSPKDPKRRTIPLTKRQEDAALEQAGEVLAYVVDRLVRPDKHDPAPVLRDLADMANAEFRAWEAWTHLPVVVREAARGCRPVRPSEPAPDVCPSEQALAAYVAVLTEDAQREASTRAKRLESEWMAVLADDSIAERRAALTDLSIDVWKDGQ